jgi:hypothetical protein
MHKQAMRFLDLFAFCAMVGAVRSTYLPASYYRYGTAQQTHAGPQPSQGCGSLGKGEAR